MVTIPKIRRISDGIYQVRFIDTDDPQTFDDIMNRFELRSFVINLLNQVMDFV
jgi:hypothetical protein